MEIMQYSKKIDWKMLPNIYYSDYYRTYQGKSSFECIFLIIWANYQKNTHKGYNFFLRYTLYLSAQFEVIEAVVILSLIDLEVKFSNKKMNFKYKWKRKR